MQLLLVLITVFGFALTTIPAVNAQSATDGGLKAEITGVSITVSRGPVVTFKISDLRGKPLELDALDPNSVKFTIAVLKIAKSGEADYGNYVLTKVAGKDYVYKGEAKKPALPDTLQPDVDHGGVLARLRAGVFTYTFKTALPPGFDQKATHVVGGELTRDNRRFVANPLFEFVPAGGKVTMKRDLLETASCNRCHDPMRAHRGTAREVGYCALCHTSQLIDPETGESLDFKYFVHKLHRGNLLPSVRTGTPYFTIGAGQRVADFSTIASPLMVVTETIPKEYRNCTACHAHPKVINWQTLPSSVGCVSCHDDIDLRTGKNHSTGPAPEGTCVNCHRPEGPEFGPSIMGAHTFPGNSTQLPGTVFDILKVEGGNPGSNPVVTFSIRNKKGEAVNAAQMNNLSLVLAWPTVDYQTEIIEDARKAEPLGNGVHVYKFQYTLPASATGSGAVGIYGYRLFDIKRPSGTVVEKGQRDAGFNVVKYFPITDREAVPRRKVVKIENCNACHLKLLAHGEQRNNTELCVLCHNAKQTDAQKRKTAKGPMPPENIHFKRLIHRIHTGKNLGEPVIVYGGPAASPVPTNFSEIRFPGDRRNCTKCHEQGANEIPLPDGVLPTQMPQADGTVKVLTPIMSACVACHTKEPAKAHMEAQIAAVGRESCVVCHGVGREFSVEKVHRR